MISFLKLDVNIMDDDKIYVLEQHSDFDKFFRLWIGILCIAMKSEHPGLLLITEGIPYKPAIIAKKLRMDLSVVERGLQLFDKLNMIEFWENPGAYYVINFEKHQNLKNIEKKRVQDKLRQRKHRAKLMLESGKLPEVCGHSAICSYCGTVGLDSSKYHLDHVIPIAKNGTGEDENIVLSCEYCNKSKGPKPLVDFLNTNINRIDVNLILSNPKLNKHVTYNGATFESRVTNAKVTQQTKTKTKTKTSISDTNPKSNDRLNGDPYTPLFEKFWSLQERKVGKGRAFKEWTKACKKKRVHPDTITSAWESQLPYYKARLEIKDTDFPHPATWINEERWNDEVNIDEITKVQTPWEDA